MDVVAEIRARAEMKGGPDGARAKAMAEEDRDALLEHILDIDDALEELRAELEQESEARVSDVAAQLMAAEKERDEALREVARLKSLMRVARLHFDHARLHLTEYKSRPAALSQIRDGFNLLDQEVL